MSKVQSTCQDEQFEEIYFLLEKYILRIIFGTWTEICRPFGQTLPHGRQNALYISRGWFCRECIDFKFNTLYYLGILSRETSDVSRYFSARAQKLPFTCSNEHFEQICLIDGKSLHLTFPDLEWKTLNFMGNSTSLCRVAVKTINHLSGKTILPQLIFVKFDSLSFWKNELKKLLMLSKCFSGSLFKSVHYVTRETFEKKQGFEEKMFETIPAGWVVCLKHFKQVFSTSC